MFILGGGAPRRALGGWIPDLDQWFYIQGDQLNMAVFSGTL